MSDSVENGPGANLRVASGSDPASSLRAAALLTLKPKRRKPIVDTDTSGDQGLSQRPPAAETSVQLGYGQEDIGSSPTDAAMPSVKGTLRDMERQRRQELLARKAVQGSTRPPSPASSIASSSCAPADQSGVPDQDAEMAPVIATEAVDHFRKTIGEKGVTREASIKPESTDTMEVDEIPGLAGSTSSHRNGDHGTVPETHRHMPTHVPAESSFSTAPIRSLCQNDPPPFSAESGSTAFGLDQAVHDEQLSHHQPALQRRGSKRPRAADFVDFDSGSRNGYHGSMPNPLKRKRASFASVMGHRKLVIDLSDSEGEDDVMRHAAGWQLATPVSGKTPPGTMASAALMEKEQEICKMREMIAQREMSRKQKMSRTATTPSMGSTQREEDLSLPATHGSAGPHRNGFENSLSNGTIPAAVADKRTLPGTIMAGSASTSASATPPNIGSLFSPSPPPTSDSFVPASTLQIHKKRVTETAHTTRSPMECKARSPHAILLPADRSAC